MALDSMKEIFERSARENIPFWEIVLQYDMEERQVSRQASMAKMLSTWQAIQDAADSYTGTQRSVSGLVGGDGLKMRLYARRGESIGGEFMDEVIVQAISMAESNACMRRIVAAPTAGSCGVVPAVLLPLCEREHYTQHELLEALYVASGIGAAGGPVIMGWALAGSTWQSGYRIISILQIVLTAVLLFSLPLWQTPADAGAGEDFTPEHRTFPQLMKVPGVPEVMCCFALYSGVETVTGMWAASYCTLVRGLDATTAASWAHE